MILAVGQEKQNELMIFFSYWFGLDFFLIRSYLVHLVLDAVQNKGSRLSWSHKCRCEGI